MAHHIQPAYKHKQLAYNDRQLGYKKVQLADKHNGGGGGNTKSTLNIY